MIRDRIKRLARHLIFPFVEAGWTALFSVVGLALRPKARLWSSRGEERVLVVAPHPDDETLGCGGVIALHARAGDLVHIAIGNDGSRSRAGGPDMERIAHLRQREAERAVARLGKGIQLTQLGLPEGLWQQDDLVSRLLALLRDTQPHVIYAPSCVDFHPEHLRVAQALARALADWTGSGEWRVVRAYEVQVPLTPLLVNLVAPIGRVRHIKHHALREYQTQSRALPWSPRLARYWGALYRLGGPAEAFWELSPETYSRLILGRKAKQGRYRGLRPRPFTDGLAWVIGLRERMLLAKQTNKR